MPFNLTPAVCQALCQRPPTHGPAGRARRGDCLGFTDVPKAAQSVNAKATVSQEQPTSAQGSTRRRLPSWMGCYRSVAYCFLVTAAQRGAKMGIINIVKVIENVVFFSLKKRSIL